MNRARAILLVVGWWKWLKLNLRSLGKQGALVGVHPSACVGGCETTLGQTKDKVAVVDGIGEAGEPQGHDPMGGMIAPAYAGRPRFGKSEFFWKFIEHPELNKEGLGIVIVTNLDDFVGCLRQRFHGGDRLLVRWSADKPAELTVTEEAA